MHRNSIASLNFLLEKYTKDEINYYILRHTTIDSDYSINLISCKLTGQVDFDIFKNNKIFKLECFFN
jgi:hypothetical protein